MLFPNTFKGRVNNVRNFLWLILTEPKYNSMATIYAWLDQLFIFISILGMIVETLPVIKSKVNDENMDIADILSTVSICKVAK